MAQRRFALLSSDDVPGFEGCGFGYSKFNAAAPESSHPSPQNFSFGVPGIFGVSVPNLPINPFIIHNSKFDKDSIAPHVANIRTPFLFNDSNNGRPLVMRAAAPAGASTPENSLAFEKAKSVIKSMGVDALRAPNILATAQQVSDIVLNFNDILGYSWPDSIKSSKDTIQRGKDNYLIMERNSIPVAQDLYNYSQAAILYINSAIVNKTVPLPTALQILKKAVVQRAQNAQQVTRDHIAYKDQFDKTVNDMKALLAKYNDSISVLNDAIAKAEKEHKDYTITAAVFGVLTFLFIYIVPVTVVTFPIMVGTAVKASQLQMVIDKLTSDRNNIQTIIDFLIKVLAKLKTVGDNLNVIITIWGTIEDNLAYITDVGYDLLQVQLDLDPTYQPLQFEIDAIITQWNSVKTASKLYLDTVRAPTS